MSRGEEKAAARASRGGRTCSAPAPWTAQAEPGPGGRSRRCSGLLRPQVSHGTGAVGAARARASCLGCCSLAERARVGERLSFPPVPRKADLAALSVDQLHFPKSFVILSKFDSQTCRYFRFIIIIFFNQKFIYLFTFILENGFLSVTAFPKHC